MKQVAFIVICLFLFFACSSNDEGSPEDWRKANLDFQNKYADPPVRIKDEKYGENRKLFRALEKSSRSGLLEALKAGNRFTRQANLTKVIELALLNEDYELFTEIIKDPNALAIKFKGEKPLIDLYLKVEMQNNPFSKLVVNQILLNLKKNKKYHKQLAFHLASRKNIKIEIFSTLKKIGFNLDTKNSQGDTLLIFAIKNSNFGIAKELIKLGSNVYTRDLNEMTALMLAADANQFELFKLLAKSGSDLYATRNCIFKKNRKGTQTPIHSERNIKNITLKPSCIMSVVLYAVKAGSLKIIKEFYQNKKYFDNYYFESGNTALIRTILNRDKALFNYLIELGYKNGEANKISNISALSYAIEFAPHRTRQDNLSSVIEKTRDYAMAETIYSKSVLAMSSQSKQHSIVQAAFTRVNRLCDSSGVKFFLAKNVMFNLDKIKKIVLDKNWYQKKCKSHLNFIKLFRRNGLSLGATNAKSKSIIHFAIEAGHYDLVKYLLEQGQQISTYKFTQSKDLLSYLAYQAKRNSSLAAQYYKIASLLLSQKTIGTSKNIGNTKPVLYNFLLPFSSDRESHAVYQARMSLIDEIIKNKTVLNQTDILGRGPLHYIISKKSQDFSLFKKIVNSGVNINALDARGRSLAYYLAEHAVYGEKYYRFLSLKNIKWTGKDDQNLSSLHYFLRKNTISQARLHILDKYILPEYRNRKLLQKKNNYLIYFLKWNRKTDLELLQLLIRNGLKLDELENAYRSINDLAKNKSLSVKNLIGFSKYHLSRTPGSFNALIDIYFRQGYPLVKLRSSKASFSLTNNLVKRIDVNFTQEAYAEVNIWLHVGINVKMLKFNAMNTFIQLAKADKNKLINKLKQVLAKKEKGDYKIQLSNVDVKITLSSNKTIVRLLYKVKTDINMKRLVKRKSWRQFVFEDGDEFFGLSKKVNNKHIPYGIGKCLSAGVISTCEYIKGLKKVKLKYYDRGVKYIGEGLVAHQMFARDFIRHGRGKVRTIFGNQIFGKWKFGKLLSANIMLTGGDVKFRTTRVNKSSKTQINVSGECTLKKLRRPCRFKSHWIRSLEGRGVITNVSSPGFGDGIMYSGLTFKSEPSLKIWLQKSNNKLVKYYRGTWSGKLPHGVGLYINQNFAKYSGSWQNGFRHGRGDCLSPYGVTSMCHYYRGYIMTTKKNPTKPINKRSKDIQFYLRSGEHSESSTLVASYRGEFKQGEFHGEGVLASTQHVVRLGLRYKGDFYQGNFSNGYMDGTGSYYFKVQKGNLGADLLVYKVIQGEFNRGAWPSKGTVSWKNGAQYKGPLAKGAPHGKGICRELLSSKVARAVELGQAPLKLESAAAVSCQYRNGRKIRLVQKNKVR